MPQIKLELRNKTLAEKIQFIRQVAVKLTGNPHFPNPEPSLAELGAIADRLEKAYNEHEVIRQEAQRLSAVLDQTEAEAGQLLKAVGGHVESRSLGDVTKILSAGLEVRSQAQSTGELETPGNLSLSVGDAEGEIDAAWDRVRGARTYLVQLSPDPFNATSWKQVGVPTRSSSSLTGLESGKRYWVRVAAVGVACQAPGAIQR